MNMRRIAMTRDPGRRRIRPHDSAPKHVSGRAIYIDDMPEPPGLLHAFLGLSPHAHARIKSIDLSAVSRRPAWRR